MAAVCARRMLFDAVASIALLLVVRYDSLMGTCEDACSQWKRECP
jgi:hypothetical protein